MSDQTLILVIVIVSAIVVGISVTACAIFMRFMKKEKERGEKFREIHGPPDT